MVDPWSGPTPTPQQFPKNEINGIKKLLDKIDAVALQAKESTSNLLRTAGLRLTRAGLFIDSSLTVGGSLDVTGPMVVGGTLSLPAGIIGNDSLTSPVAVANVSGASNGMAINVAETDLATTTVPVPAGYSQALVFLEATTSAYNNTAAFAYLYIQAVINGTPTRLMPSAAYAGTSAYVGTAKSVTLTGLSGGTISIAARVSCDNGWGADAVNRVYTEATVVFLR